NVIQGIAIGLEAVFIPFITIGISIFACLYFCGVFGVAIACLGMICVCGVVLALDAFGPVTDNAGGLAEMAQVDEKVRETTDELDAIGNMTKATTKGYAVYSAALATLVLMTTFKMDLIEIFAEYVWIIDLTEGTVLAGLFI
ncbi:MAG: sodium-translocating pyrophosphatase, partial [Phototrophicales bacterium]